MPDQVVDRSLQSADAVKWCDGAGDDSHVHRRAFAHHAACGNNSERYTRSICSTTEGALKRA